jgi:hypothetical protein
MTTMTEVDYQQLSEEHLLSIPRPDDDTARTAGIYKFSGNVAFGAVFAWWDVTGNFHFDDARLELKATLWGPGLVGGMSWGGGVSSVPPSELVGDVGVSTLIIASGGGPHANLVQLTIWKGIVPVAVFVGGGIGGGVGGGAAGGGKLKAV